MLFLAYLRKLIKIINENATPGQIGGGVALGAMVGLIPGLNLLSFGLLLVLFLVNVNLSTAFMAIALFKVVGYIVDPLAHDVGLFVLTKVSFLTTFWTTLYNIPFVPFTRFNNTVVMGNLVVGLLLFFPIFLATKKGIVLYRERWRDKVAQWKIIRVIKASKVYGWYQKISQFQGD